MKSEVIEIRGTKAIGIAKEIKMSEGQFECPKFWHEFTERFIMTMREDVSLTPQQEAIQKNMIGEFGLCICDMKKGLIAKSPCEIC